MATLLFSGKEGTLSSDVFPNGNAQEHHSWSAATTTQSAASDASAAGHTPPLAAWGGRRGVRDLTSAKIPRNGSGHISGDTGTSSRAAVTERHVPHLHPISTPPEWEASRVRVVKH